MKPKKLVALGMLAIWAAILSCSPASRAQASSTSNASGSSSSSSNETHGIDSGLYNIQQTIDFGYRLNEINGNQFTYDTFIDLGSGVRLFDYTLDVRSRNRQGLFFDDLNFSNFGYGGDPNDVSRLHVDKLKWYDFHLLFRRDKYFWDYNLWANPLNPAAPNPPGSQTSGCILSPPSSANPGLPGLCSNPAIAQTQSPQQLNLVRRMQDYDLTMLPQSKIGFRLGYSHNREEGPGFFTTDSGTVPDFPESYSYTTDAYRMGIDFRVLPRTTFSFDEFLIAFKQDNGVLQTPAATPGKYGYQLPNGTPVDLGIVWSTQTPAETLPCPTPILNPSTTPPTANPSCNGFLSYSQVGRPRNFMPTERLRFQSNYFQKFETTGSFGYSSSDNTIPDFDEILNGYVTRTSTRVSTTSGPAKATRVSVNADWSGVYNVTDKFHILDFFRFDNWRIPGMWAAYETNVFGAAGTGLTGLELPLSVFNQVSPTATASFATLCPAPPYDQPGCPLHTSGSGADITNELNYQFLGQDLKSNTFQLQYDFTKRISGRIGYLYTNRSIGQYSASFLTGETYFPGGVGATAANYYLAARGDCSAVSGVLPTGCTLNPNGSITLGSLTNPFAEPGNDTSRSITTINENSLLLGFIAHPVDQLSLTGDFSFGYNDAAFTRIDPRQIQSYKVGVTYTPKPWATLNGAVEIHENRDNVFTVANLEHDRMYSFTTMLLPSPRVTIGFGYNYWDVYTQSEICFNYSIAYSNPAPPPSTLPVSTSPPGVATTACPIAAASVGSAGLGALSTYASTDHFAHAELMWKATKRITVTMGYAGSFVRGNTIFLNPLTPSGTLDYNYQTPYSAIAIDIIKGLTYKMAWNYYGFNQKGITMPFGLATIPLQDFNGSNATFSFRYSF